MEKAGLENEAIRFALKHCVLASAYIEPRLKKLRAAREKWLVEYVHHSGTADGSPPVLFGQFLTAPYATFGNGERPQ